MMSLPQELPPSSATLILKALERELVARRSHNRLKDYAPYPKQIEFHEAGASFRERLFMAGNQLGKTWAGAYEVAMHLTGIYPDWWKGRRFDRPVAWMAGSESGELTRKGVQRLLLGPPQLREQWGTGAIPKACLDGTPPMKPGVPDAVSSISVKHVSGGTSIIQFASYDQGRTKWQADTLDGVWFDEEPPQDIYFEGLTRTNATAGMVMVTFTPLLGMSEVVRRYLLEKPAGTTVVNMTIYDAAHYTKEQADAIVATYPPHERDARAKGIPTLGSGRIFPLAEESISIDAFEIPAHWVQIGGIDFGWDHPTAAIRLAWDRDNDCVYVTNAYRLKEATPVIHASSLKAWADWLPWAWPHDGLQHDKGSGDQLADLYRSNGLEMLHQRATFEDGTNGVEAGLMDMLERMQTGRLKVFRHLTEWFEEFRLYHRKDGKVVKEADDLMAATRYALMMKREAKTKPKPFAMAVPRWAG